MFADLVRVKGQLYAVEDMHGCATLPPALEMTEDQHERMRATQAKLTEMALAIHRHPAFEGLDQMARFKLDEAASKAARAGA